MNREITSFLILVVIVIIYIGAVSYAMTRKQTVEISVYNPYRISATLRVKCDWDNNLEEFIFDKEIKVPGNSNTKLVVPNRMKKCQIWPKIDLLP